MRSTDDLVVALKLSDSDPVSFGCVSSVDVPELVELGSRVSVWLIL